MTDEERTHVPHGYTLDRDEDGLTAREREVRGLLLAGHSVTAVGKAVGVSRQRAHQLAAALVSQGVLRKEGTRYVDAG